MVAMVMFAGSLVLLAIAIMMNKRVLYLLALPSSALAYAQFPMIQIGAIGSLWAFGDRGHAVGGFRGDPSVFTHDAISALVVVCHYADDHLDGCDIAR